MAEHCWKCATPVAWSAGTGAFCPNPACDVVDALDPDAAYEVRIRLDHASEDNEPGIPGTRRTAPHRELAPQG
ncbi:hypothetical protein [Falsiroseomonas bella]|uniref:hypothetical protein n=1 Tax=Falsiroseomonas bella TaxID=2184016 RepID=UPI001304992D|nr:hypothetical protein [Falsiroseomonas bella]